MSSFQAAKELVATGRFSDAIRILSDCTVTADQRLDADVLRADLLERTGRSGQSRQLAESLLKSRHISPRGRSTCEVILGRLDWEEG